MTNQQNGTGHIATQTELDKADILAFLAKVDKAGDVASKLWLKEPGDVAQSFALWLVALAIDWKACDKARKKSLDRRHKAVKADYLASLKAVVTIDNVECELTKAGRKRMIGTNDLGLPSHVRQTLTVERFTTIDEQIAEGERRERADRRAVAMAKARKAEQEAMVNK